MGLLYDYQLDAVKKLRNGSILCGGVGSGKSRTALGYFHIRNGGSIEPYKPMVKRPMNLYIITTARKRDSLEWLGDMAPFHLSTDKEANYYDNNVVVDSWNNIKRYVMVANAFFIFDEQRVVGSGAWVKAFYKIVKRNEWILLSATPGDTWSDYIPVFVANGFYKNKTEFSNAHIEWERFTNFPKIRAYHNEQRLMRLRDRILVDMDFERPTVHHDIDILCQYDTAMYKTLNKTRWNFDKNEPMTSAAELCYCLRKLINSDKSRVDALLKIVKDKHRVIVFYSYDYELDILTKFCEDNNFVYAQYNGHLHQPVPEGDEWIYLCQYTSGCEAWNCIVTDTIVFYSQTYSYKVLEQACGRIDRLNTPFIDLYYYHLRCSAGIDLAIRKALKNKKKFNESRFVAGTYRSKATF